ncbi:hypothetical protein HJC23_009541 [Cyclotella cryptica]|uniref:Uncharacterized protein n=1 Tax=Cyclotella cryptica TaxID=29204 RepID=A0ABD3Q4J8_9STRA
MKTTILPTSLILLTSFSRYCVGYKSALPAATSSKVRERLGASLSNPIISGRFLRSSRNILRSQSTGENRGSRLRMANEGSVDKVHEKGLFLFDFDGVVCDSCDECTVSAWRTCHLLNAIKGDTSLSTTHPPQWLFDKMREIRPAIEVGWQIPVLLSVLMEQNYASSPDCPAMTVPEILENYESLVLTWLEQHSLIADDMIHTFGKVRDDWIENDLTSWLDINVFYHGIAKAISHCSGEVVLVTTKQQRFATALVRHAGIPTSAMPDDSIYGLGMYKSKADVIVERMTKRKTDPENTHFFEDRWPTIAKCLKDKRLEKVKFYLCSWGYCTPGEVALASQEPRVEVLSLDDFSKIVK